MPMPVSVTRTQTCLSAECWVLSAECGGMLPDSPTPRLIHITCHRDAAAVRREFVGIREDVEDNLTEAGAIRVYRWRFGRDGDCQCLTTGRDQRGHQPFRLRQLLAHVEGDRAHLHLAGL